MDRFIANKVQELESRPIDLKSSMDRFIATFCSQDNC